MSAPTEQTRSAVYGRDGYRCVACTDISLTFQHRRAVGMGGSKIAPPPVDGLTMCLVCNEGCEGAGQDAALTYGWKVRKWADPSLVPVWYPAENQWYLLAGIDRVPITPMVALDAMHAVYGEQYLEWARDAERRR